MMKLGDCFWNPGVRPDIHVKGRHDTGVIVSIILWLLLKSLLSSRGSESFGLTSNLDRSCVDSRECSSFLVFVAYIRLNQQEPGIP